MFTFLQAWNHDFFWSSLCPGGGGTPEGEMLALIERDFGSYEEFEKEFKQAGATQFGAGWVWLVCKPLTIIFSLCISV
jgi:Fe-Mn family superoxide dismutase